MHAWWFCSALLGVGGYAWLSMSRYQVKSLKLILCR